MLSFYNDISDSIVLSKRMILVRLLHLAAVAFLHVHLPRAAFSPNTKDYDAYGPKIAMNSHLLVLAQNNYSPPAFAVQFAPYNHSLTTSQCSITSPNISNTFIYTAAIGKQQNYSQRYFFFVGEHTNEQTGGFIGMANLNALQPATANLTSAACNRGIGYSLHFLSNYTVTRSIQFSVPTLVVIARTDSLSTTL